MGKFYITTPLYYVNASPHIGHSYTNIAADCLARYMRQKVGAENVWLLTGTDEHGQKMQKAAEEAKLSPQEFTDKMVLQFKKLWEGLDISYNDFIRTTEERHISCVQRALTVLYKNGDIYLDKYEGWYCTPCETFWAEAQIQGENCPDCQRPLEKVSEKNYFFKLSKYQDWLGKYIEGNADFIRPETRRREVSGFLKSNKLSDLCISRPKERLSWGIPLPFSPGHVTYVWFDALLNYISAVGTFNKNDEYESKWWPGVHIIGKDILRQHAIYWPIMLKALNIRPPAAIFAHGWWLIEQSKMSKSRGNVVSPKAMVDKFGLDAYRYFLLRDVPFGQDGNFSEEAIIKRFNSDLANDLGNLLYRTLTMIEKYFQGNVPEKGEIEYNKQGKDIEEKIKLLPEEIADYLHPGSNFNFSSCLEKIWALINMANKFVEDSKPWNLAKEKKIDELKGFIHLLVEVVRAVSELISPFMPHTAMAIDRQIGKDRINKGRPLFPRIDRK